jgi:hypothetical protein
MVDVTKFIFMQLHAAGIVIDAAKKVFDVTA